MKKTFTSSFLGLVISGLLLASCSQLATYENEDLMLEQTSADKAGFKLSPFGNTSGNENAKTYASDSWDQGCVPENGTFENGDFFELNFNPVSVQWGGKDNDRFNKIGNLTVYNTATKFVFRISSTEAISDLIINGISQEVGTPANTVLSYAVDLPSGWKAGDEYSFTVDYAGNGPQIKFPQTTYKLVGVCGGCDIDNNEFSGIAISCAQDGREAVYTFGSEDGVDYFKMQGGLTNFTGGNASVYINGDLVDFNTTSVDGWATGTVGGFTVGQRNPGGSSNRNIRVEGGLGSCEEVEVKILWDSTNTGTTITGNWSVKDEVGEDLAPPVAGLTCS